MNKEEFIEEIKKLGISITDEQLNKIEIYIDFLIKYNEHTNLTRITNREDILLKHFYDSLTIVKYVDLSNKKRVLDIGTGAGFPGMVLKIFYPNLEVTLLDSNNKKIKFLEELSELLNINVNLINDRAEEFVKNYREYFDIVVSRAVASLNILLELAIPFVKNKGLFVAMKSNVEEELKESTNACTILDVSISSINKFNLIKEDSLRTIIIFKKNSITNRIYPRLYSKIKKNPL